MKKRPRIQNVPRRTITVEQLIKTAERNRKLNYQVVVVASQQKDVDFYYTTTNNFVTGVQVNLYTQFWDILPVSQIDKIVDAFKSGSVSRLQVRWVTEQSVDIMFVR